VQEEEFPGEVRIFSRVTPVRREPINIVAFVDPPTAAAQDLDVYSETSLPIPAAYLFIGW
jgi:hypothetical protein